MASGIISAIFIYAAIWGIIYCLEKRSKKSVSKLDDELLPTTVKVLYLGGTIIVAALFSYSLGFNIPGLTAVATMMGAAITLAIGKFLISLGSVIYAFLFRPYDIGQQIEYEKKKYTIADIDGLDFILVNTDGDDTGRRVGIGKLVEANPVTFGRWNDSKRRFVNVD